MGAAPQGSGNFFFDDFLSIFGKMFLVLKKRILGNAEFQKNGNYVTGRNVYICMVDVFNDVSKY